MTEEKKQLHQSILEKLCAAYNLLIESGQVAFPIYDKQRDSLESIVKTVEADYFGTTRFTNNKEKIAAYFYLIIKDHPMTDGNKRLSVLWLETLSAELGESISLPDGITLDVVAVSLEKNNFDMDAAIEVLVPILFSKTNE